MPLFVIKASPANVGTKSKTRASKLFDTLKCQESGRPGEDMQAPQPFLCPFPVYLFLLLSLSSILYNKLLSLGEKGRKERTNSKTAYRSTNTENISSASFYDLISNSSTPLQVNDLSSPQTFPILSLILPSSFFKYSKLQLLVKNVICF